MYRYAAAVLLIISTAAESGEPKRDAHGDPLPEGAIARLGTVRFRDVDATFLSITPDGKTIITTTANGPIQTWDATTGEKLRSFARPGGKGETALSSDGKTLVEWHPDVGLRVWDVASGKERRVIKPPEEAQGDRVALAISPDGQTVFVAGENLLAFDLKTGVARTIGRPQLPTEQVVSSSDGKKVVTLSRTGEWSQCWDAGKELPLWTSAWGSSSVSRMALSPDGNWLLAAARRPGIRRHLFDSKLEDQLEPPRVEGTEPDGHICIAVFSPDSKILALGEPHRVVLWDVAKAKELRVLPTGARYLAFAPDGKSLITLRGVLQKWDIETGKPLFPDSAAWGHTQPVTRLTWSHDGKQLMSGSQTDTAAYFWDVSTARPIARTAGVHRGVQMIAFTPSGDGVSVAAREGVFLWDSRTGALKRHVAAVDEEEGGFTYAAALATDGKTVVTHSYGTLVSRGSPHLTGYDLTTGQLTSQRITPYPGWSTKAIDGRSVIESDGRRFDPATDRKLPPLRLPPESPTFARAESSPDGAFVAGMFGTPGGVGLWDAVTGQLLWSKTDPSPREFAMSPDGRTFAIHADGKLIFFDVAANKPFRTIPFPGHTTAMAFSPDGTRLATGHNDSTILLWDAARPASSRSIRSAELDGLWSALGDDDAANGVAAAWKCVDDPKSALPWLRERLTATAAPKEDMGVLIASLGSPQFGVREKADLRLRELGGWIEPALRTALAASPTPEARRRIDAIIATITEIPAPTGDELRRVRIVHVLERIGSPEANELLSGIAKESDTRPATWAARAAVGRK